MCPITYVVIQSVQRSLEPEQKAGIPVYHFV